MCTALIYVLCGWLENMQWYKLEMLTLLLLTLENLASKWKRENNITYLQKEIIQLGRYITITQRIAVNKTACSQSKQWIVRLLYVLSNRENLEGMG